MANQLRDLRSSLWSQWGIYDWARTALENEAFNLEKINDEFYIKITTGIKQITETVAKIDKLILYNNLPYGDSIQALLQTADRAESFLKQRGNSYVNRLIDNATKTVEDQIDKYVQMVIRECNTNVGKCAPLAYIYDTGVDLICKRLVDPMVSVYNVSNNNLYLFYIYFLFIEWFLGRSSALWIALPSHTLCSSSLVVLIQKNRSVFGASCWHCWGRVS